MIPNPFVLPGSPGKKTLADNLETDALFKTPEGVVYAYRGLLPDGRWVMYSTGEEPRPFMMADLITGFPAHPTQAQILDALVHKQLRYISNPLDDPARERARRYEKTKEEVLAADPYAEVRWHVTRGWDAERPSLSNFGLTKWSDMRFDWEEINRRYGRKTPKASTLRNWIRKRGKPGNRCWADMEDTKGQGPRTKRVTGFRLAIAVWHAASYWTSRRNASVSKLWKDVEADVNAYNLGLPLIMHNGTRVWPKPDPNNQIKVVDPEFFRQLVKRLECRESYKNRYSAQAAQQRWEGGGGAIEPTRFLEVVQQDECDVPAFFFIDSINRVPLGLATWVIAVDIYTKCILAWDLSFDAPSRVSWMRNVLNASEYKRLPREYAERFPDLATIGGRISAMMYDNPTHLIGQAVEDAHGDIVQDVIYAGDRQPTHKGLVERTHRTLAGLFTKELPGAKMQVALSREFNIDPSKTEKLLTLEEGRLAMARAICKYHTENKGSDGRVPLDRWMEQLNRWGPQHAKDQEQFARAIGNVTFDLVLDSGGIKLKYLEYSDVEITPLLMEAYARTTHHRRNSQSKGFDAKVKWDPTDMSHVSVFDPDAKRYCLLPAKMKRYTAGLTYAMHRLVMRHNGASSLMKTPDGETKLLELRRLAELEIKQISPKMEKEEQRARAAIMQLPTIKQMMSGDIHLLEVAPSPTGQEVKHELGLDRADSLQKPPRGKRGAIKNDANFDLEHPDFDDLSVPTPGELQSPFSRQVGNELAVTPGKDTSDPNETIQDGTVEKHAQLVPVDADTDTDDFDDISQY